MRVLSRTRLAFLLATSMCIAAGLFVHLQGASLSPRTRDWLGDALWASMMTGIVSVIVPHARATVRCVAALAICYAVEGSQLLHTASLDAFRATTIGHLMLGSDFDARDLLAYTMGVVAFGVSEVLWTRARR